MFINTAIENGTLIRVPRQLVDFFSHKTILKPSASGKGSRIQFGIGDSALPKVIDSPAQAGLKTASKLIEDGGEFIRTPFKWIKDIQANWLIYVVCAAIICLTILFFYCMVQKYFARKQNVKTGFTSQVVDMAMILANNRSNCTTTNAIKEKSITESNI
jgi:hypothetical protein